MASQWTVLGGRRFDRVSNGDRGYVGVERVLMQDKLAPEAEVLDLLAVNEVRPGGERRGHCKLSLSLDTWRRLLPVIQCALDAEVT